MNGMRLFLQDIPDRQAQLFERVLAKSALTKEKNIRRLAMPHQGGAAIYGGKQK